MSRDASLAMLLGALALCASACTEGRLDAIDLSPDALTTDLTTDLMAHYTFDEGSGTTVIDHSGNERNGTLTGGTWLINEGKFGGALHLDGSSYVTVSNFPNAPPSFTVSAWARTATWYEGGLETLVSTEAVFEGGWEINVENNSPDASTGFQSAYWDPGVEAGKYPYTLADCPACLPHNIWTHVAFVVDASTHTLTMYINGEVWGSPSPAPDSILPGTPQLFIGRWSLTNRLLIGDIDDLAIYGRALVQDDIQALQRAPAPDVP